MTDQLRDKLKTLPARPGVYFHKSASGEIIYVGKAAVLKNRVRSYFRGKHDVKTAALVREIADTDWIETDSEIDALFLESEMIKRYMPRYNILLRDDKTVIYVRINFRDKLPTVTTSRNPADDGAEYIGPFYSAAPLKLSLRYLKKVFPFFAKKQDEYSRLPTQLGLVPDVFSRKVDEKTGEISRELDPEKVANYKKNLRILARYLRGERVKIQTELEKQMRDFATNLDFENAAKVRNQLRNLNELKKQIIFSREEFMDASKDQALADLKNLLNLPAVPRRIEAYDVSHQGGKNVVASMVVATSGVADRREYRKFKLSREINDDTANLREVLMRRFSGRHANWTKPDLIILDGGKAQISAAFDILSREQIPVIGRDKSGDHSRNAAVKIVVPKNGDELNFQKDSAAKPADANPRERFLLRQKGSDEPCNDTREESSRGLRSAEFAARANAQLTFREIPLNQNSHIAKLIARLDDEAHRFAISYHENLKRKNQTKNALEEIPGVGAKTRQKLLRKFGSVAKIREAPETDIAKVVGAAKAELIKNAL